MSDFKLTILGSGSAIPSINRLTTSQIIKINKFIYLIDCGEACQIALKANKININKIDAIFISHLHGDHYFGLIGLLNTMHLMGRKKDLSIYCFKELQEINQLQFNISKTTLSYTINYVDINNTNVVKVLENKYVEVFTIPLKHRIPCCGFLFKEKKRSRNIKKEFVAQYKVDKEWFPKLLEGQDFIDENKNIIPNSEIVLIKNKPRSYAYCSDTLYNESIIEHISGVDLLYHEATFDQSLEHYATEKFHSTAQQAAQIALKAEVKMLIIGHFSSRYKSSTILLKEAQNIFSNTIAAYDGLVVEM